MADSKLTTLSLIGSVTAEDLLYIVDDPGGSPVSRKVTLQTMCTAYLGATGMTGGTVTASTPLLNQAQTWNSAGVTFTGWKLAITSTASAAASKLIDLTVAGATEFAVDKSGFITGENFTSAAQGLVPASGGGTTNFLRADGTWTAAGGGGSPGGSTLQIQYNNAGAFGGANVWRNGANQIDLSNGVTAQALFLYNTTDTNGGAPTNYERGVFDFTSTANFLTIGTQKGGTGTIRPIIMSFGTSLRTFDAINSGFSAGFYVNGVSIHGDHPLGWVGPSTAPGTTYGADISLNRVAVRVLGVNAGGGGGSRDGWIVDRGHRRAVSDFSVTSNTTLADSGLGQDFVENGRTYSFQAVLFCTTGATAGGIKVAVGGTATVSAIVADGIAFDGTTVIAGTRVTAKDTNIIANTNAGTTPKVLIWGTFTTSSTGTIFISFAQNASSGTASVVKAGSWMLNRDMPS